MRVINVVGARPNFMKVAPLQRAFEAKGVQSLIVHTGQHYDKQMSDVFFTQLGLPQPDYYLGIGGGTHSQQTARIMMAFEEVCLKETPDLILVVGDVNSTIACALVAKKLNIRVAHVEAGLRSRDREMPEEINRVLTDSISDFLFVTEMAGMINLAREGVPEDQVFFTGNVMIDSLVRFLKRAEELDTVESLGIEKGDFGLMTMHRPSNVDAEEGLKAILKIIEDSTQHLPIVFPIHPRTRNNYEKFGLLKRLEKIQHLKLLEPQGYLPFLNLMANAKFIITDSGGIQEETTFLQVPCLTFRNSTERPVTVELGTNKLIADLNPDVVYNEVKDIIKGQNKKGIIPPLWDGHAAGRIVDILLNSLSN